MLFCFFLKGKLNLEFHTFCGQMRVCGYSLFKANDRTNKNTDLFKAPQSCPDGVILNDLLESHWNNIPT